MTDPNSIGIFPAMIVHWAVEEHMTPELVSRDMMEPEMLATAAVEPTVIVTCATAILEPDTVLEISLPRINTRSIGSLIVQPKSPDQLDPRVQLVAFISCGLNNRSTWNVRRFARGERT